MNIITHIYQNRYGRYAIQTFCLALAYFVTGKLGSLLAVPPGYATVIWPPSGIALAAMLLCGYRASWGIFLGCLTLNFSIAQNYDDFIDHSLLSSFVIAFGATLQAAVGRFLLKKFTQDDNLFANEKSVFQFMCYAGVMSSLVNASISVSTLIYLGKMPTSVFLIDWFTWWVGDAIGIFIFTPILLTFFSQEKTELRDRKFSMSIIFLCTFSLTFFLVIYEIKVESTQMTYTFEDDVKDIKKELEKWLGFHLNTLYALQSFYLASHHVEKDEFQFFASRLLKTYQGIDSLQWIPVIDEATRQSFTEQMRQEGFSDFTIRTDTHSSPSALKNKPYYYAPLTLIEPLEKYRAFIGLDFLSHPPLEPLLLNALRSDKIWISSMITGSDIFSSQLLSFIPILEPSIYKQNHQESDLHLRGFISASFDIRHLIHHALNGRNIDNFVMTIHDKSAQMNESALLFSNADRIKAFTLRKIGVFEKNISLVNHFDLKIANRHWQLDIEPSQDYFQDYRANSSWFILLVSLFLTSLVGGFVMVVSGRRHLLQQQVTQTTHALEESEIRFKTAFEHAPIGVANIAINGYFLEVNQGLAKFLGYSPAELSFITHLELTHPADRAQEAKLIDELLASESSEFLIEKRYRNKSGHFMWANLIQKVIFNHEGMPDHFIAIIEDIHEKKIIERERAEFSLRAMRELEEQKQMQHMMQEAQRSAEALAKSKSEFLANMSHEIRTPMNAIIGFSDLALDKEMPEDVRNYIVKIHQASENLLHILNDILDVSKIEAGKLELENAPFNLVLISRNLYYLFSETAKANRLAFRVILDTRLPTTLIGDGMRLQQILSNLISNAIKFTVEGKVEVSIELLQLHETQAAIRFSVVDTGIGIKKEVQSQLFNAFTQADTSITRRFGGTGLGLTICKNLLTLMGGDTFRIKSIEGKGTTIYFDLTFTLAPLTEDNAMTTLVIENTQKEGGLSSMLSDRGQLMNGMKVLLAEDNTLNQEIICSFLSLSGINVDVAENGLQAIELLNKHHHYDVILMDVNMDEMGGIEATTRIRQQARFQGLPIIALTAGMTTEEQQECFDCGMNDIIGKPINPEQMLDTLARWTQKIGG